MILIDVFCPYGAPGGNMVDVSKRQISTAKLDNFTAGTLAAY